MKPKIRKRRRSNRVDGKVGLDDFLISQGADALKTLMDDAEPWEPSEFNLTDVGNAERLVEQHGDKIRYCRAWRKWLVWNGHCWKPDARGAVVELAKRTVRMIYDEAKREPDPERSQQIGKHAVASEKGERIDKMLKLAQSVHCVTILPEELDKDPLLLNCLNGTVDLTTGELREPDPNDLITKSCVVDYDPEAECPQWERFLAAVLDDREDLVDFVHRAIGYSLTGLTNERVLFFAFGVGKNGKSTLIATVQAALGNYSVQAPPNLLVSRRGESHPTELMRLAGSRFVAASETEDQRQFAEALVKQLTGGTDRISARLMRSDFTDFTPTFKFWISGNHRPTIRGTDDAIWDRIRVIPFTRRFDEPDKELPTKLLSELPGILAWAVRGCVEWSERGLEPPREVRAAVKNYRSSMDAVGEFIQESCVERDRASIVASELYTAYARWCERSRERVMTKRDFYKAIEERGIEKYRSGSIKFRRIELRSAMKPRKRRRK